MVSYSSRKEAIRDEVGEEAYDLVKTKMNENIFGKPTEKSEKRKIAESEWQGTIDEFVGLIGNSYATKEDEDRILEDIGAKREKTIEVTSEEYECK